MNKSLKTNRGVLPCTFYVAIVMLMIASSFAHEDAPPEAQALTSSLTVGKGATTGGYGFISPHGEEHESEASNVRSSVWKCADKSEYACYLSISPLSSDHESIANNFLETEMTKLAREKLMEYNLLNLTTNEQFNKEMCSHLETCEQDYFFQFKIAELNGFIQSKDTESADLDLDCFAGTNLSKDKSIIVSGQHPDDDDEWKFGSHIIDSDVDSGMKKSAALGDAKNLKKMIPTLIWFKHLEQELPTATDGNKKEIEFQMRRIKQSFPALFPENYDSELGFHERILKKVYRALAARTHDPSIEGGIPIFGIDVLRQGKEEYNNLIHSPWKFSELIDQYNAGISNINEARTESLDRNAITFMAQMDILQEEMNKNEMRQNIESLKNICGQSFKDIASSNPQVIRQLYMDATSLEEKQMLSAMMCQEGMEYIQKSLEDPKYCEVTDGDLSSGMNIRVGKGSYPYGDSERNVTYQKDSSGNLTIRKNLGVTAPSLSDAQKECFKRTLSQIVGDDLNCQVGATESSAVSTLTNKAAICAEGETTSQTPRKCPTPPHVKRRPTVKFELNVFFEDDEVPDGVAINDNDVIELHTCYNSDIPRVFDDRSDCEKVKQLHQERCITNVTGGYSYYRGECDDKEGSEIGSCCNEYVENIFINDRQYLMRANAANLTMSSKAGTWRHEILHQFGLKDEYSNENMPISPQGTRTSIMRSSSSLGSTIKPWHVDQLVENLSCD